MPIEFACENCGRTLRVPEGSSGKRSQCPACGRAQEVPYIVQPDRPQTARPTHSTSTGAALTDQRPSESRASDDDRLSIPCPNCKHLLLCSPDLLGTRGQCRQCQHIFTITTEPQSENIAQPAALVFSCPKCQQLFEGKAEMEGRSGKCHVCQSVFEIALRPASVSTSSSISSGSAGSSQSAQSAPNPRSVPPGQSAAPRQLRKQATKQTNTQRPPTRKNRAARQSAPAASRGPIQFMCGQCQGLMEVPGSAAGLETACPYCQTVQRIPSNSTAVQANAPVAASSPDLFESLGSPLEPFGSINPYATVPQSVGSSVWQSSASTHRRTGLTFGNVFSTAFAGLFPTCLVTVLHLLVMIGVLIMVGVVLAIFGFIVAALKLEPTVRMVLMIGAYIVLAPLGLAMGAWFISSVQHMALRAVRQRPFDFNKAFSPGGAYGVAFLIAAGNMILELLRSGLPLLEVLAPGSFTPFIVPGIILITVLTVMYLFTTSLASYAAIDGDDIGQSFATSARLVFTNFPLMLGVKILVWIMAIVLAIPTLGLAFTLPFYFNATLYHLARQSE